MTAYVAIAGKEEDLAVESAAVIADQVLVAGLTGQAGISCAFDLVPGWTWMRSIAAVPDVGDRGLPGDQVARGHDDGGIALATRGPGTRRRALSVERRLGEGADDAVDHETARLVAPDRCQRGGEWGSCGSARGMRLDGAIEEERRQRDSCGDAGDERRANPSHVITSDLIADGSSSSIPIEACCLRRSCAPQCAVRARRTIGEDRYGLAMSALRGAHSERDPGRLGGGEVVSI